MIARGKSDANRLMMLNWSSRELARLRLQTQRVFAQLSSKTSLKGSLRQRMHGNKIARLKSLTAKAPGLSLHEHNGSFARAARDVENLNLDRF